MVGSQPEFEGEGDSLNSGVVAVKRDTKSIVGRCSTPPPLSFGLTEPVPPGACAILVREDFMEIGLEVSELWLHRLYVAGAPSSAASPGLATLILHKAGEVWLTGSVLQGRNGNGRALDVTAADGGDPRLYVEDVAVVNMVGCDMPGLRCGAGTDCTVTATSFKHNAIPGNPARCQCGSAIGVLSGGSALLLGVEIVNNTILSAPAGARAVAAFLGGVNPAVVFSDPPMNIWDISGRTVVTTRPASESHTAVNLPENGTHLHGIQEEQAQLWASLDLPVPGADPAGGGGGGDSTEALEAAVGAIGGVLGLLTLAALGAVVFVYARRAGRGGAGSEHGSFKLGRLQGRSRSGGGGPEIPQSVDGATVPFGLDQTSTSYPPSLASIGRGPSFSAGGALSRGSLVGGLPPPRGTTPTPTDAAAAVPGPPGANRQQPYGHNPALVRSYSSHSYPSVLPWSGGRQGPLGSQNNSGALPPSESGPSSCLTVMDGGGSAHGGMYGLAARAGVLGFLGGTFRPDWHSSVGALALPLLTPEGATHSTTIDTTAVAPLPPPAAASGDAAVLDRPLLEHALDNMHAADELFMGKFAILGPLERRAGGQGIVQFAVARPTGEPVAIKFFLNRKAFDCEETLYGKAHLRGMMPAVTLVHSNDDASLKTHEGWYFPPCIVVERGESLDEWRAHVMPDFCTIAQVLIHVTERVATLHAAGVVHRDLKPGNVLWRPRNHTWTLIDYGCAAEIGTTTRLTFSMAYSPPETLHALHAGAHTIMSDAASDIWAIGVITYELVLGAPAFPARDWTREQLTEAAMGERAYPWEKPGQPGQFRHIPQARALSSALRACLNRNPTRRPTAAELRLRVNQLFDDSATTSETAPCRNGTVSQDAAMLSEAMEGSAPVAGPPMPCARATDTPQLGGRKTIANAPKMPSARSGAATTSSLDFASSTSGWQTTPTGHTGRTRHFFNPTPCEGPPASPSGHTLSTEDTVVTPADMMPKLEDVYRELTGVSSAATLPHAGEHDTQQPFVATGSAGSEAPFSVPSRGASAAEGAPMHVNYSEIPPALLPVSLDTRGGSELPPLPSGVPDSESSDGEDSGSVPGIAADHAKDTRAGDSSPGASGVSRKLGSL